MSNIGKLEIFMGVALIMGICYLYKEINRKKYLGELILKLPKGWNTKAAISFWILLGFFWIFFLLESGLNIGRDYYTRPVRNIATPILGLLACLLNLLRYINVREIREKGITIQEGFVYWKDIIGYSWKTGCKLEIVFKEQNPLFPRRKTTKVWDVEQENKIRVDEIFNHYTKDII